MDLSLSSNAFYLIRASRLRNWRSINSRWGLQPLKQQGGSAWTRYVVMRCAVLFSGLIQVFSTDLVAGGMGWRARVDRSLCLIKGGGFGGLGWRQAGETKRY